MQRANEESTRKTNSLLKHPLDPTANARGPGTGYWQALTYLASGLNVAA